MSNISDTYQSDLKSNLEINRDRALWANRLITLGITLGLFGLFSGAFHFWDENHFIISPAFSYTLAVSILVTVFGCLLLWRQSANSFWRDLTLCPFTSCTGLLFVFFSDWLTRGFNLFQGPMIRGELISLSLILYFALKYIRPQTLAICAICSCFSLLVIFIFRSNGHPIMTDDHASFIYRMTLLKDHFPKIPFYNPLWNAGLDARDFFATGSIAFFLLTAPLNYFFEIAQSYNYSVAFVLFVVLPLSLAYASKLARVPSPGPAIASILGLATSLVWYRWGLKYGTMGFITSASLMPMVFVLGCKLISSEKLSKIQLTLFILATSLACMWPLGGVCYISILVLALFKSRLLYRNKQVIFAVLFLVIINLPWAMMFWKVSKVGNFLQSPSVNIVTQSEIQVEQQNPATQDFRHKNSGLDFKKALKVLREQSNGTNPLILFLFLPGLFLLKHEFKKAFIFQALLLTIGGSLLVTIKPQLELDRLLVFLTILLVIPTARTLVEVFYKSRSSMILSSVAFSFVMLTPLTTSNILYNRSAEAYRFGDSLSANLVGALNSNLTSGRAVFSGFVLHELNDGHVAPLALWSKKPLVASSPFHNRWKYTSVFPNKFLEQGEAGISEFLDLLNVEVVLAHEPHWRSYFLKLPDQFEAVWHQRPFLMFKRKHFVSNYFLKGSGEIIEQTSNSVRFQLKTSDAILKFSYFPFLKASTCTLAPFEVGLESPFIQVSNCPINTEITLESVGPMERLFQ